MKQIFTVMILLVRIISIHAEDNISLIEKQTKRIDSIGCIVNRLENHVHQQRVINQTLVAKDRLLEITVDSIKKNASQIKKYIKDIEDDQSKDRNLFRDGLKDVNENLVINVEEMDLRTVCGGILLLISIIGFSTYLYYKRRKDFTFISEVKRAQEALRDAQTKMQEESIKLDNQLLTLVQKQFEVADTAKQGISNEPDHSLVVKLADEIARIETNLSKMDKSVRGYKQLVQAKDRMINNVRANGYEIISLLGQDYNDGMQFQTRFVPDDSLPEGKRVISGMIKMQVNYNGKMIQPAEIVVSQNI